MYIQKVHLQNFKRFTDLVIDLSTYKVLPKLVLVIGANGGGKSSLFDAFHRLLQPTLPGPDISSYYRKNQNDKFKIQVIFDDGREVYNNEGPLFIDNERTLFTDNKNIFYGRTSMRQLPRLERKTLGRETFMKDDRSRTFIDLDNRFENDIENILNQIVDRIFREKDFSYDKIRSEFIDPFNEAFARIFVDDTNTLLKLISITPPGDSKPASIQFSKGGYEFHYDVLSNGEKEIFNILFNLFSRRTQYSNTVYYFDEIDLHLNTALQKTFLKEIVEYWLPEKCQLWTASHSLGFIEYANEVEHAVIIDFDGIDFDQPQILTPLHKDASEVFEIAVPKDSLKQLLTGKQLFFAENKDTRYYNGLNISNTIFIDASNKNDVFFKVRSGQYSGIIDRDYLLDDERALIIDTYPGLKILEFYSIENYLYHPDNLEQYFKQENGEYNKANYVSGLIKSKNEDLIALVFRLQNSRSSYPFFKESGHENKRKQFDKGGEDIAKMLESNNLTDFYPYFPMKDYGTTLPERQNLDKLKLSRTNWFKSEIEKILK
ncbi:MAG: AAA family ATPase [Bacteroidota bacterium]|nr:AAA family ATPase [Bacteroidota bacterium]